MKRIIKSISCKFLAFVVSFLSVELSLAGETYEYDAQGRLIKVTYDNGNRISYAYDASGNLLSVAMEGNRAPGDFRRLQPQDSTVVQADNVQFVWSDAVDPDGDPVTYTLALQWDSNDTSFTTRDTSLVVDFSGLVASNTRLGIRWSVQASDSLATRLATNAQGLFFLDPATAVEETGAGRPTEFALHPNYPNPFNPQTTIRYDLPVPAEVRLTILDMQGRTVRRLVALRQAAGSYTVVWDGRDHAGRALASGVYVYQIRAGGFSQSAKMLMLK
ncbi:MAG: FlgD immunoglobulin-like domain containing protein [candidate division KSB1 bacterium]|nr:FlgD immunoglobulin-like domain containing protein [candidate division KSB1 bacterium]